MEKEKTLNGLFNQLSANSSVKLPVSAITTHSVTKLTDCCSPLQSQHSIVQKEGGIEVVIKSDSIHKKVM